MSNAIYDELERLLFGRDFETLERRLVEAGWDRVQEESGTSLLRAACYASDAEDLVTWLLGKGFKPNPTAVLHAMDGDNNAFVVHLLVRGMDMEEVNYQNEQGKNYIFDALDDGVLTYIMTDGQGESYRQSELARSCQIIEYLIASGVRVDERNNKGETPLRYCVGGATPTYSKAHETFAALLMNYGADPHSADDKGVTPIDHATKDNNKELVAILTKR